MLLNVVNRYPSLKKIYVNDINSGLTSIYRNIKNNVEEFCGGMDELQSEYLPLSKEKRKEFFFDLRSKNAWEYQDWEDLKESYVLYFLMKTGFNGIWQINKNTNNRYGTPSGLLNQKDRVYDKWNVLLWNEMLNKYDVEILNGDWKDCPIGDFTFYDPPYRDSFANYNTRFPDEETELLIKRVEESKNVWLCNRDSNDGFFDNKNATTERFPITYTAGRRKKTEDGFKATKATEILLYN
jgi:DNA adenine methylase